VTPDPTVVVLAKAPVPGKVKTRLCPPLTSEGAAELAEAALVDTLAAVAKVPGVRRVLALDGLPGQWLPGDIEVVSQPHGGLDVRIAAALTAFRGPTVVVGMDTPQITAHDIECALDGLSGIADAVIGPALDGGYWLLGLAVPDERAVLGVPMSVAHTGAEQRARLDALGLTTSSLRSLRDIDDFDDARAVAHVAPASRFAKAFRPLQSAMRTAPCS
jgi:hypothetical protein